MIERARTAQLRANNDKAGNVAVFQINESADFVMQQLGVPIFPCKSVVGSRSVSRCGLTGLVVRSGSSLLIGEEDYGQSRRVLCDFSQDPEILTFSRSQRTTCTSTLSARRRTCTAICFYTIFSASLTTAGGYKIPKDDVRAAFGELSEPLSLARCNRLPFPFRSYLLEIQDQELCRMT